MELKENVLYKPVIMNSISKCGINPPPNGKNSLSLGFLFKVFPSVLILVLVSHRSDPSVFTAAGIAVLARILWHKAVLWHHTPTLFKKVLLTAPKACPEVGFWAEPWNSEMKFLKAVKCLSEGGFLTRKLRGFFFFSSNNYFLSPKQAAEAFSCHSLTPGLCFPPVAVATSKGRGGSCVWCSLLMSSPRW